MIGLISQMGYVVAYASAGVIVDFIIQPFLKSERTVAQSILVPIGRGERRGGGIMIIPVGVFLIMIALLLLQKKEIRELEEEHVLESA